MAISPLAIATLGVLNSPLSVASNGELVIFVQENIRDNGGGPLGGIPGQWQHPSVLRDKLEAQLKREDDEILAIIMASMRYLQ